MTMKIAVLVGTNGVSLVPLGFLSGFLQCSISDHRKVICKDVVTTVFMSVGHNNNLGDSLLIHGNNRLMNSINRLFIAFFI